jgi:hypothetical protein
MMTEIGPIIAMRAPRCLCAQFYPRLQSNTELCSAIDHLLMRADGVLWALMALLFVVASLGMVNRVAMNVRDQLTAGCAAVAMLITLLASLLPARLAAQPPVIGALGHV